MDEGAKRLFYDNQDPEVIKGLADKIMNTVVREGRMVCSDGNSHDLCILVCRILHLEKDVEYYKEGWSK